MAFFKVKVSRECNTKRVSEPTIIHGNVTINNSINLNSDGAGSVSE